MTLREDGATTAARVKVRAAAALRVLLYTRVSKPRPGQPEKSPTEQYDDLAPEVAARGWVEAAHISETKGASRHSKGVRTGWARVLDLIGRGDIDVLMVWEPSRLTRSLREALDFVELCERTDTHVHYWGHTYDLANSHDRARVIDDVHRSEQEVEQLRERSARGMATNLRAGLPAGKVPFGYRRIYDDRTGALIGQAPLDGEAPVVRDVFTRVAAGDSIFGIIRDLNAAGVKPRQGERWSPSTIRNMLRNVTYLGHRTHHGRVVVEDAWPPIVDEVTFYRVQAIVGDPSRRYAQDVTVKHLCVGVVRCGVCGSGLSFRYARQRNEAQYRCKARGCVAVDAARLDVGVRLLIAEALSRPDALDLFLAPDPGLAGAVAEHKALTARLADAEDALDDGDADVRDVKRLRVKLEPQIAELEKTVARARRDVPAPVEALAVPDAAEVAARFDRLPLVTRRLVVRTLLAGCELRAAPSSRRRRDLGLRFRWAGVGAPVEV